MPTYVYKCLENEHIFEKKQRFSDPPVAECPECGSDVRKLINSVGVVFKGSGFYVTDNRGSNSAAPGSKSEKADSGGGGESKASSDSAETTKKPKETTAKKSAETA